MNNTTVTTAAGVPYSIKYEETVWYHLPAIAVIAVRMDCEVATATTVAIVMDPDSVNPGIEFKYAIGVQLVAAIAADIVRQTHVD